MYTGIYIIIFAQCFACGSIIITWVYIFKKTELKMYIFYLFLYKQPVTGLILIINKKKKKICKKFYSLEMFNICIRIYKYIEII